MKKKQKKQWWDAVLVIAALVALYQSYEYRVIKGFFEDPWALFLSEVAELFAFAIITSAVLKRILK
jgi:hypothetical protein